MKIVVPNGFKDAPDHISDVTLFIKGALENTEYGAGRLEALENTVESTQNALANFLTLQCRKGNLSAEELFSLVAGFEKEGVEFLHETSI